MSVQPLAATSPPAVWQLHTDIFRLFRVMTDLHRLLSSYGIEENRFTWLQDSATSEPDYRPRCECDCWPICKILERIGELVGLADNISRKEQLFLWFGMAFEDQPPPVEDEIIEPPGRRFESYHRMAFEIANNFLWRLQEDTRVGPLQHDLGIDATKLEDTIEAAKERAAFHGRDFLDAEGVAHGLRIEGAHALDLAQRPTPVRDSVSHAGANDELPVAGHEDDDPVDTARDKFLYERREHDDLSWSKILEQYEAIRKDHSWRRLTNSGVRSRVKRYVEAHDLPLRRGKGGAPKRKK